jgi:tetratricopeptide (TPR) repeat protein
VAARNRSFEDVVRILAPLLQLQNLTAVNRAVIGGKCAFAFEKLGDYESAFSAYREANRVLYAHYEPAMRNLEMIFSPESVERLGKSVRSFKFLASETEIQTPVFLVGFPRSGTTLLDQVLSSHSRITVLEEKPNLIDTYTRFPATKNGLWALENAAEVELEKLRQTYWDKVNRDLGGAPAAPVIIDKLPLNAIALLHIFKLFPRAKIVVALRDPRDCVFSCYQQRFGMNLAMFQLLDLDSAVRYYDLVMALISEIYDAGVFEMHFVRYENVVANFTAEIGALIRFLGLEWEDGLHE